MTDQSKFTGSEYEGYKVSVKLVRKGAGEYEPVSISDSEDVYGFMRELESHDRESFYTIHLDAQNTVLSCEEVSRGGGSECTVNPREVYKGALLSSANSIVFVHNHPSGNPNPSREDLRTVQRLYDCGKILGIPVVDSVIIGNESYFSYADKGILKGDMPKKLDFIVGIAKDLLDKDL